MDEVSTSAASLTISFRERQMSTSLLVCGATTIGQVSDESICSVAEGSDHSNIDASKRKWPDPYEISWAYLDATTYKLLAWCLVTVATLPVWRPLSLTLYLHNTKKKHLIHGSIILQVFNARLQFWRLDFDHNSSNCNARSGLKIRRRWWPRGRHRRCAVRKLDRIALDTSIRSRVKTCSSAMVSTGSVALAWPWGY